MVEDTLQGSNEKLADIKSRLAIIEKRTTTFDGYLLQILDLAQRQHNRSGSIVMVPRLCMPPPQEDTTKTKSSSDVVPQSSNVTSVFGQPEAVGLSKGTGQWHGRISQIPSSTYDKDISSLPAWSDFDSTTELCGLFTSTPDMTKPAKLPKLERIEMTCLGRPASLMTHDMQVLMQDSVTQSCLKRTVLKQAARGCGRGRRNNRVDPTEPRIPKTYEMVFRPFNNMGLSLQECKLTAYIFGKELPLEEILFKYSFFDLPQALFMSLSPPPHIPHVLIILDGVGSGTQEQDSPCLVSSN
ncbi:hypothetical protein AAHE18_20G061800 [Arachis hypogaea]